LHKLERLREIGKSFDAKITPLLTAEQQPKFQALRDEARRKMIETMGSAAVHKLEGELEKKL
jgi:Spy/CpxP family protein refolding chaperone